MNKLISLLALIMRRLQQAGSNNHHVSHNQHHHLYCYYFIIVTRTLSHNSTPAASKSIERSRGNTLSLLRTGFQQRLWLGAGAGGETTTTAATTMTEPPLFRKRLAKVTSCAPPPQVVNVMSAFSPVIGPAQPGPHTRISIAPR